MNLLTDDADAAIAELEKGAAWDEDAGDVAFDLGTDLGTDLAMTDDELAQLVSDTPVLDDEPDDKSEDDDEGSGEAASE
jgi:hypothetical protein